MQSTAVHELRAVGEAVRRSGDEAAFLRIARLAAALLGVEAGAVTLVDTEGELVLGREGPDLGMLPFCRSVVASVRPLLLEDTLDAHGIGDDRATTTLRAYAGVPILTRSGHCLGALCAGSAQPRPWGPDSLARLEDLAAMAALEMDRGRRTEELHLARERYSALLEHHPDIAWTKDATLRYTACNSAMQEDLGLPGDRIVGATAADLFPPEVARALEENDRYVLETGRALVAEERVPTPDGGDRIIDTTKAPIRDSTGTVIGLVGIARDITDRRAAEETLRQSEQRYRSLFQDVPVGLYRTRANGEILAVNQALAEMLGYDDPAELEGGRFSHQFYVDLTDRNRWREIVHREDQVRGLEFRQRTADGRVIWVRFNSRVERDDDGEILYYEGAIEDITLRREAEEARREAEARAHVAATTLRMTLEAAPIGIAVLDAGGHVESWNSAAGRILRRDEADVIGQPFPGVVPDHFERFRERVREALAGEAVVQIEDMLEWKDGTRLHSWISLGPLPPGEDGQRRVVAILADLTEQKELEEQLRQAQKMEAVGRLAGGIAHDFNNVLTAIGGHVQLLLDELSPDHAYYQDLVEVRQGAVRAAALTRQLLAFSRQQVLRPKVVDLGEALRALEPMLRRLIRENIQLAIRAEDACRVRIDPNQFEQIIVNLVVNARDAIESDGRISVAVSCVRVDEEETRGQVGHGEYVRLSVADTGTGMEDHTLARIFEPFFTTKEPGKGTGLGLSTVYGTVKQSGGFIWADSDPGAGTVFDILFPLSAEETAGAVAVAPDDDRAGGSGVAAAAPVQTGAEEAAPPAGAGERVLLVEDEASVREVARRVLERRGYRVTAAAGPLDALRLAGTLERIDLLVSDVVMPDMSGGELADRLRDARPDLPVLLMSGYTADEAIRSQPAEARSSFLEKPFTPAQLAMAVQQLLERRTP